MKQLAYENLSLSPEIKDEKCKDKQFEELRFTAKCMMNVKPDIAVLYEENGRRYFLFLECKFESPERPYTDKKAMPLSQRKVQWMVADFLCKYCFEEEIVLSGYMEEESCLVRFGREKPKKNESVIEIETLIELNHEIIDGGTQGYE